MKCEQDFLYLCSSEAWRKSLKLRGNRLIPSFSEKMEDKQNAPHVRALDYALKKCMAMPDYHSASSALQVACRVAEMYGAPADMVDVYEDRLTDFFFHRNEPAQPQGNTYNYDIRQNMGPLGNVTKQEFMIGNETSHKKLIEQ